MHEYLPSCLSQERKGKISNTPACMTFISQKSATSKFVPDQLFLLRFVRRIEPPCSFHESNKCITGACFCSICSNRSGELILLKLIFIGNMS